MKTKLHDFFNFAILCIGLGSASSLSVVSDRAPQAEASLEAQTNEGFLGKIVLENKEPLFGHSSPKEGASPDTGATSGLVSTILANAIKTKEPTPAGETLGDELVAMAQSEPISVASAPKNSPTIRDSAIAVKK